MTTHPSARIGFVLVVLGVAAEAAAQPLPNPYRLVDEWPHLPSHMNGGRWGETIGVDRDADGNIWVFHRCFNNQPPGAATCVGRDDDPPVVKFSPDGELLDSWGEGVFAAPHGFHIDPEGNFLVSEGTVNDSSARISILDPQGGVLARFDCRGSGHGSWIDSRGDIYLAGVPDAIDKYVREG